MKVDIITGNKIQLGNKIEEYYEKYDIESVQFSAITEWEYSAMIMYRHKPLSWGDLKKENNIDYEEIY